MPQNHSGHNLERQSHHAFGVDVAPAGWTVTRINDDYGLDDRVEAVGNGSEHAPGLVFHVQHKATADVDEAQNWFVPVDVEHLNYWRRNVLPVLISLYFSKTGIRYVRWAHGVDMSDIGEGQKTRRVRFTEADRWVPSETINQLEADVSFLAQVQRRQIEWPLQFGFDLSASERVLQLRPLLTPISDLVVIVRSPWRLGQPKLTISPGEVRVDIGDVWFAYPHPQTGSPHPAEVLVAIGICLCRLGQVQEGLRVIWHGDLAGSTLCYVEEVAVELAQYLERGVLPKMALDLARGAAVMGCVDVAHEYMGAYSSTAFALLNETRQEIADGLSMAMADVEDATPEEAHLLEVSGVLCSFRLLHVEAVFAAGDHDTVCRVIEGERDALPLRLLEDACYSLLKLGSLDAVAAMLERIERPSDRCLEVGIAARFFSRNVEDAVELSDRLPQDEDTYWGRLLVRAIKMTESVLNSEREWEPHRAEHIERLSLDPFNMQAWMALAFDDAFDLNDRFHLASAAAVIEPEFAGGWAAAVELGLDLHGSDPDDDATWLAWIDVIKGGCDAIGLSELELALYVNDQQTVPDEILAILDSIELERRVERRYPVTAPPSDS